MAWARIDDGFHDHPKVDALSLAAVGLWTLCLSHAHRHRRTAVVPGHVTEARVKKLAGRQAHALVSELLAAGLWEPESGLGGWVIHDFADYLPKDRDPDERREAGRKGAAKRWQADSKLPFGSMGNDGSRASAPAFPSRPVPSQEVVTQGGERQAPLRPVAATEPPPTNPADARCTGHRGVADPGPCNGCRAERERAERKLARDIDADAREAEARARACNRCDGVRVTDDNGRPTRTRCDHRRSA